MMPFRGMSLKNKIIFLSIALIVFISGIYSAFYLQYISRQIENSSSHSTQTLAYQVSLYFDEQIRSIITSSFTLTCSDQYHKTLLDYFLSDDSYAYPYALSKFNDMISNVKMNNSLIGTVYVYTPKGDFYDLSDVPNPNYDFLRSQLYAEYQAAGCPSFFEGHSETDEMFMGKKTVIPFVIRTPISGYAGDVFFIVSIDRDALEKYFSSSAIRDENILIVNSGRQPIASNDPKRDDYFGKMLSVQGDRIRWKTRDYIVSAHKLESSDWFVVAFYNKSQLRDAIRFSAYFVVILIVASGLIAGISSIYFSSRIVRPLEKLQEYMVRVTQGDFSLRYEYPYKNEVGRLTDCFNYMVKQIGTLVTRLHSTIDRLRQEKENVRQEQALKRAAELNALQAQINPHFLYNTLNSIVWLATEQKTDEITLLASELSKFYEYRIHRGKKIIPIRDEIEQVKSYLTIQKMRYGNSLDYHLAVDENLLDKLIVKMVVQPLVENSILHGIQCKEGAKDIYIRVYGRQGDIVIEVEDRGIGIPPERLKSINERLADRSDVPIDGYGIYNVNERIKLYFGDRYGLWYESEYERWTKACIRVPPTDQVLEHSAL